MTIQMTNPLAKVDDWGLRTSVAFSVFMASTLPALANGKVNQNVSNVLGGAGIQASDGGNIVESTQKGGSGIIKMVLIVGAVAGVILLLLTAVFMSMQEHRKKALWTFIGAVFSLCIAAIAGVIAGGSSTVA